METIEKLINSADVANIRGTKVLESGVSGPTVGLMCLTHGNELNPVRAVMAVMEDLQNLTRGKVLLTFNNLAAFEAKKRFVDQDMNRIFRPEGIVGNSSEVQRARELAPVFDQMDIALDLHSVTSTRGAKSFTVIPGGTAEQLELARRLKVAYQIIYPQYVNGTGSTSDYFVARGKPCISLETGDDFSLDISDTIQNIRRYLAFAGVIDARDEELVDQAVWMSMNQMEFTKNPRALRYDPSFPGQTFAPVKKGQLIATEDGKEYRVREDGFLLFKRDPAQYADENLNYFENEPFLYLTERG